MSDLASIFDATLLNSTLRFVAPILLAALGGLICERAGVFNIALEGLMLTGAFAAVAGSYYGGSLAGVATAVVAGAAMAAVLAVFAVRWEGDEIVVGIAVNLLATGLTVFLLRTLFGVKGAFSDPQVEGLSKIHWPVLGRLPILGDLLSGHSWVAYLAILMVAVTWWLIFHHPLGLRLRGVGENPQAAETLGVNAKALRTAALVISGMLCGLAGAQLSLGNVTLFVEGMSAGRGWIAVVAVMLGRAHPFGVAVACLVFGFTDSVGFRLQGREIPSQLTSMLPYVVTLAGLAWIASRRARQKGNVR